MCFDKWLNGYAIYDIINTLPFDDLETYFNMQSTSYIEIPPEVNSDDSDSDTSKGLYYSESEDES